MRYAIIFIALVALSCSALAHLDAGVDVEQNGYLLDFGYSPEHPTPGTQTALSAMLVNKTTSQEVKTPVWMRISRHDEILFAGTLSENTLILTFPAADDYDITVEFKDEGIRHTFNLDVREDNTPAIVLIVLLFLVLWYIFIKRSKVK